MSLLTAPLELRLVVDVVSRKNLSPSRSGDRLQFVTIFPTPYVQLGNVYWGSVADHAQIRLIEQANKVDLELLMSYFVRNFEQREFSALTQTPFLFVVLLALLKCPRILMKEHVAQVVLLTVILECNA